MHIKDLRCAVVGHGSWATAIAKVLSGKTEPVRWYVRNPEVIESLQNDGRNCRYLSDVEFDKNHIRPSSDINEVVRNCDTLIFVTPSPYLKGNLKKLKERLKDKFIVTAIKGIVPDVGGPAVNMYGWECAAGGCNRRMCVHPAICKNLRHSLKPLAEVLKAAVKIKGVRKVFLGSGLRYDLIRDDEWDVFEYIIFNHISGQLKVAPEHFDKRVLTLMRKGANADFAAFAKKFYDSCDRHHKKLFLVPYLMTAFPGSQEGDKKLIKTVKELHLVHEQIQEFTPTPGSMGSAMFYTETDFDGKSVWVPKTRTARMSTRNKLQKK